MTAFTTLLASGAMPMFGLVWRRKQTIPSWFISIAFAESIVAAGMMRGLPISTGKFLMSRGRD